MTTLRDRKAVPGRVLQWHSGCGYQVRWIGVLALAATSILGLACEGDALLDPVEPAGASGGIFGRVLVGGSPMPGAIITIREARRLTVVATRITDATGSYAAEGLIPGAHTVSIEIGADWDARCAPLERSAVVVAGHGVEASFSCIGAAAASLRVSVRGRVTVNITGEPGATVTLSHDLGSPIATTTTNTDGRYEFAGVRVPYGVIQLSIQPPIGATCRSTSLRTIATLHISQRSLNFFCSRPNGREVSSVRLFPSSLTVGVYDVARLNVVVRDTAGAVIANPDVEFVVSGLAEGTVDATGLVTGLPGRCSDGTVVARSGGVNSNPVAIHIGSPSGSGCWDY